MNVKKRKNYILPNLASLLSVYMSYEF